MWRGVPLFILVSIVRFLHVPLSLLFVLHMGHEGFQSRRGLCWASFVWYCSVHYLRPDVKDVVYAGLHCPICVHDRCCQCPLGSFVGRAVVCCVREIENHSLPFPGSRVCGQCTSGRWIL